MRPYAIYTCRHRVEGGGEVALRQHPGELGELGDLVDGKEAITDGPAVRLEMGDRGGHRRLLQHRLQGLHLPFYPNKLPQCTVPLCESKYTAVFISRSCPIFVLTRGSLVWKTFVALMPKLMLKTIRYQVQTTSPENVIRKHLNFPHMFFETLV